MFGNLRFNSQFVARNPKSPTQHRKQHPANPTLLAQERMVDRKELREVGRTPAAPYQPPEDVQPSLASAHEKKMWEASSSSPHMAHLPSKRANCLAN